MIARFDSSRREACEKGFRESERLKTEAEEAAEPNLPRAVNCGVRVGLDTEVNASSS
jgi:hypothetical protein